MCIARRSWTGSVGSKSGPKREKIEPRCGDAELVVAQGGERHPVPTPAELLPEREVRVEVAEGSEGREENRCDGRPQFSGFMFGIAMPGARSSVSV